MAKAKKATQQAPTGPTQPTLFTASGVEFATKGQGVKKNGLYMVPASKLETIDGFNDREDYGSGEDMDELAESIYQNGPSVPLKGYKSGEKYVVISGHRRQRAGEMIMKKYGKDIIFPFQVYPIGTKKQDMLLDTLLSNSGKDMTPLEKASTVSKLSGMAVPAKEIARGLGGVSEVYVKNLLKLSTAPDKVKKLIRDGVVSSTYVIGVLKDKKIDLEQWFEEVVEMAKNKKGEGKQAKVTRKDREKAETRAASSLGEFKRFRKTGPEVFKDKEAQGLYEFLCKLVDNQLSYEQIQERITGK